MQILCVLAQPSRHFVLVGCPKLWWNANFLRGPSNPFVVSCSSDVRNCGKTMIFVCRGRLPTPCACFIQFCARRCSETYILTFWMARRCSETHISILPDEPSRRFRWVDRAKLWRNANFELRAQHPSHHLDLYPGRNYTDILLLLMSCTSTREWWFIPYHIYKVLVLIGFMHLSWSTSTTSAGCLS